VDRIGLLPIERVVLASSMLGVTNRRDLIPQATSLIRMNFDQARLALMAHPTFDSGNLSQVQAAKLLSNLLCDNPAETPILDPNQRQALFAALSTKYGLDFVASALKQALPRISLPPGTAVAQMLVQLGPDLTSDPELVRILLARFNISESSPPTDLQVLEVINRLARYAIEGSAMPDIRTLVKTFNGFVSVPYKPSHHSLIPSVECPDSVG
jgi:CCR4-NOT transcription complex subunit 1